MSMDMNELEKMAVHLMSISRFQDALNIYLFMAEGDQSLDAGYLGWRIGMCYEKLNDSHSAKYWYGRAVEENPQIASYVEARNRLSSINIDGILNKVLDEET